MTWKSVRSKAPAWKSEAVGYWYVPGPLSSPVGSVTFRTVVPPVPSPPTAPCAYPVLRPSGEVAVAVMTSSPKPTGTVAENDPSGPAVVLVTDAAAPVVVSADPMSTDAPADVLPVTVVAAGVSTVRPVPSPRMSRSSWAWAQVSGEADPAALPSVNPIDAVAGSLPEGGAGRCGSPQARSAAGR